MNGSRLLVIGLDGATQDLLERWVGAGLLPTFRDLIESGSFGLLRSVPNTDTAPAWATFATGLNPGNHGLFHEYRWSEDHRTLRPVCGADRHGPAFWSLATEAGRRVCVLNVPCSYPAAVVDGVFVAGIDAPSVDAPGFCHPSDFVKKMRQHGLLYRIESNSQAAVKQGRPEEAVADALAVAEEHTEALLFAMEQTPWDLAVIVYSLPDVAEHFFWQPMVQDCGPQRHAIRDSYIALDRQVARLLAKAGAHTNVIIASDHGFGPLCATPGHLARWLVRQGFTGVLQMAAMTRPQMLLQQSYGWLRRHLSEGMKDALRRRLPGLRSEVESSVRFGWIDWQATRAYAGPSSYEIWINCQGREPHGIVTPGVAYNQVCQELTAALLDWRDKHTGHRRIRAVYRREEVYSGQYLALAPDITIEWDPAAAPSVPTLEDNQSRFDADHQPDGILLAAGTSITRGAEISGARLVDLAPTILRLLGVPVPAGLDGHVLAELIASDPGTTL